MSRKNDRCIVAAVMLYLLSAGCSLMGEKVNITDIKMANSIDVNLSPVQITDTFPAGTTKVACWFKWEDIPVGTVLAAKWDYLTEKIHILNYNLSIPRRNGMGGVLLSLPEGKTLAPGSYQVTLLHEKRVMKLVTFQVKE